MKHCANTYYKKTTNSNGEDCFTYYLFDKCVAYRTNSESSKKWFTSNQPQIKFISSDQEFIDEFCSNKPYFLYNLSESISNGYNDYISHSKENIFSLCTSDGRIIKHFDVNGNQLVEDPYSRLSQKEKDFLFKNVDFEDFIFNSSAGTKYYFTHKNGKNVAAFDSNYLYISFFENSNNFNTSNHSRGDGPSFIQNLGEKTLYDYWIDNIKIFSTTDEEEKEKFNLFLKDKKGKIKKIFNSSKNNIEIRADINDGFSKYKIEFSQLHEQIDYENISENKIDNISNQIVEKPVKTSKFENAAYRVAAKQIVNLIKKIILNKFVAKEQDKTFVYEFLNSEYGTAFINLIAGEILRNVSSEHNDKLLKLSQEFYTNSIATAEMEFITNIFSGLHHSIEGVLLEKHNQVRFNEKNALEEELEGQNHLLQEAL